MGGEMLTLPTYRLIPYSCGSALMSALTGQVVAIIGYRPIIWFGFFVMTVGNGLMIMLNDTSSM